MIDKSIPIFPKFRKFRLKDFKWYYEYYIQQGLSPYVDISPCNMLTWLNINNDLMISNIGNTIILKYKNVLYKNQVNIIPLTKNLTDETVQLIFSYTAKNNLQSYIREVPKTICNMLDSGKWEITPDRDSYEYIYSTKEQADLEGPKFYKRRKSTIDFQSHYNNISVRYVDKLDNKTLKEAKRFLKKIHINSNEANEKKNIFELKIIDKIFKNFNNLNKRMVLLGINNELSAIGIFSEIDKKTAAIGHIKVDYSKKDIFKYVLNTIAKLLDKEGIDEINLEQDLGIEGMRNFKTLLQPSRFLEKVTIRPKK